MAATLDTSHYAEFAIDQLISQIDYVQIQVDGYESRKNWSKVIEVLFTTPDADGVTPAHRTLDALMAELASR